MLGFESRFSSQLASARASPGDKAIMLIGDFNLEAAGSHRIKVDRPEARPLGEPPHFRPNQIRWQRVFDQLTEIHTPMPTHFYFQQSFLNKIDRIFTSVPRSALVLFVSTAGVIKDPTFWFGRSLSDHAPIFWSLSAPSSCAGVSNRIRPEWAEHPRYKERLQALCNAANISNVPLANRRALIVDFMRDAATSARDFLFQNMGKLRSELRKLSRRPFS